MGDEGRGGGLQEPGRFRQYRMLVLVRQAQFGPEGGAGASAGDLVAASRLGPVDGAAHNGVRERVGVDAAEEGGVAGVGSCVVAAEWRPAGGAEREHGAAPLERLRAAARVEQGSSGRWPASCT
jgi:hypothetical protein